MVGATLFVPVAMQSQVAGEHGINWQGRYLLPSACAAAGLAAVALKTLGPEYNYKTIVYGADEPDGAGIIKGGMKPKIATAKAAVMGGVDRVHVVNGLRRNALLKEIFTDDGTDLATHAEPGQTS